MPVEFESVLLQLVEIKLAEFPLEREKIQLQRALQLEEQKQPQTTNKSNPTSSDKKPVAKKKFGFNEKREYGLLEKEIQTLEKEKLELEANLNSSETDYETLEKVTSKLGEVIHLIETKTDRWLELDELYS